MLKAVFLDYTGTTVMEGGPEMKEAIMRIYRGSTIKDPDDVMKIWWKGIKSREEKYYLDTYKDEEDILSEILSEFTKHYDLKEDLEEIKHLVRTVWVKAPIFPDVKEFFDKCPLPIYVITNNEAKYVAEAMELNDLHPAGIVCANEVRAYKPHRELFVHALQVAGCEPNEAVHIGDSYQSDVEGAKNAGITPIWLKRKEGESDEKNVMTIESLKDLPEWLRERKSMLIADTTKSERIALIKKWIPEDENMEDCEIDLWEMYRDYIDGKKEIAEINAEFQSGFYSE